MSEQTFLKIKNLLDENKISYETIEHEPVITSEDAARVRGNELSMGVKAMILKCDKDFVMVTLPANKRIDSEKVKKQINAKKLRFASIEEIQQTIDCERGGVPPFGFLFGIKTLSDKKILDNKEIEFNAGLTTKSIKMKSEDYFKIADVTVGEFSE